MRRSILWTMLVLLLVFSSLAVAEEGEKPRIGVLRFTNHTAAGWWNGSVGQEFRICWLRSW